MANTKIEWTEKTWNPVTGCSPVSEGCKNCYARRMANRLRGRFGYPMDDPFKVTVHENRFTDPLHWQKSRMVFVCSMGDLFHKDVPRGTVARVWRIMERCKQHTFQVLTKHPGNMANRLFNEFFGNGSVGFLPNVWLGVSVENNDNRWRVDELLKMPAAIHFVSVEPMLEWIDFDPWKLPPRTLPKLDWVICGGESGPGKRPFKLEWARDLRNQCKAAGVPFFMKQVDKVRPIPPDLMIREYPGRER